MGLHYVLLSIFECSRSMESRLGSTIHDIIIFHMSVYPRGSASANHFAIQLILPPHCTCAYWSDKRHTSVEPRFIQRKFFDLEFSSDSLHSPCILHAMYNIFYRSNPRLCYCSHICHFLKFHLSESFGLSNQRLGSSQLSSGRLRLQPCCLLL